MSDTGKKYKTEDISFMSEVDAAIYRTGHSFAYILSFSVFLLFIIFVVWAHFAVLDEVTRGMGQVIPSQRIQVIQNLEGGILEEILVQENQIVNKNDILVRLSNEMAASQYRDAFRQAASHEAALIRLKAEAEGKEPIFSEEFKAEHNQAVQDQISINKARQQQLQSELRVLESQHAQKRQEVSEMISRKTQLQASLKLAKEQRDIAKPLVKENVYPRVEYLKLERDVTTLEGDIRGLILGIDRVKQAGEEAQNRIGQRNAEFRSQAQTEVNQRHVELNSLKETISAGKDRVTRTDVRSPVRGSIKQLSVNTIGGVIGPGEPILEIVPLDDTLLIEARIRPADIAFLHPGQKTMVKITAYDFSIYGGMEGTVEQISADAIVDEKGESFFRVKIRTKTNAINYLGENLPIIPGMTASVDILTGEKSVLSYLLKPILKAKQNALRER